MILYHISKRLMKNNEFTPKVPANRLDDENADIERVCFADTLEGCFMAIPKVRGIGEDLQDEQNGVVRVFEIDTDDFQENCIIKPEELHKNKWVSDAIVTGEHWITTSFVAKRSYLIQVQSMDHSKQSFSVPWGKETMRILCNVVENIKYVSTEDDIVNVLIPEIEAENEEIFRSIASEILNRKINEDRVVPVCVNKEEFLLLVAYATTAFDSPDIFIGQNPKDFTFFGAKNILFNDKIIYQEYELR